MATKKELLSKGYTEVKKVEGSEDVSTIYKKFEHSGAMWIFQFNDNNPNESGSGVYLSKNEIEQIFK